MILLFLQILTLKFYIFSLGIIVHIQKRQFIFILCFSILANFAIHGNILPLPIIK